MSYTSSSSFSYTLPSSYGHACTLSGWPLGVEDPPYVRLPESLWPELEARLSKAQLEWRGQ